MPAGFTFEDAVAPVDTGFSFEEAITPQFDAPGPSGLVPGKPGEKSIYEALTWMDEPVLNIGDSLFPKGTSLNPRLGRVAPIGKVEGTVDSPQSPVMEGVSETLRPAINSLTTPRNLTYMLGSMGLASTGTAGKILVSSLWTALMGKNAVEDAPQIYSALGEEMAKPEAERDKKKIASLLTQGGLDVALAVAPALHAAGELDLGDHPGQGTELQQLQQQAAQELPQQPEVPNASSQQEATAVGSDMQPFTYEVAKQVPAAEGERGIQSQAERGLPEQPQPDTAQKEVVLADEAPPAQIPEGQAPPPDAGAPGETAPAQGEVSGEVAPEVSKAEIGPASEEIVGMGGAVKEEFPTDPGNPDIYGIAERVRVERAKSGQTVPIEPGQGVSAIDAVIRGQEALQKDPLVADKAIESFRQTKAVSFDGMTAARAKGELEFRNARRIEEKSGTDSPEYKAAFDKAVEYDRASKEMQTEWSKTGAAQQGQTDIDTGTFTGLAREYEVNTGKKFTEPQTEKATRTAKEVTDAKESLDKIKQAQTDHIKENYSGSNAEKRALDAAHKTVRENAVRLAEAENKSRLADEAFKNVTEQVQKDATARAEKAANKTVRENEVRLAKEANNERVAAAAKAKKFAEQERRIAQKKLDDANSDVRNAAIKAAKAESKERIAKADLPTYLWNKARDYLDKGVDNFDDIRNKLATDLGMPVEKITAAMGKDKRAKFLTDEVWRKQQRLRQLHEQAKRWLRGQQTPEYQKYLESIPRVLFTAKVLGHGTVAMGTHAPLGLFKPQEYAIYLKNYGRMYKMVGAPTPKGQAAARAFHENLMQDLVRRPNYPVARRAGLQNDPAVYEDYNSPDVLSGMGKLTAMGNRGYSVLKIYRQDLFDQQWDKLPKTKRTAEIAKGIVDGINPATGVTRVAAPKGAAITLFAPRLEASRINLVAVGPVRMAATFLNWRNATEGQKTFAVYKMKEIAWAVGTYTSLLAINQGFLSLFDSKQKINFTDPMKSDWMKFKAAGMVGSYGNALLSMIRLPARLFTGIKNEGKLNKIVYEDENVASILFDFARSQMSPFMGTVTDLGIGRDFERRPLPRAGFGLLPGKTNLPKRLQAQGKLPYTWTEYATMQALPIPAEEAMKEVWKYQGMPDPQMKEAMQAIATFSIMMGTGGRLTKDYDLPNH